MTRITGTLHIDVGTFIVSRSFILRMRNVSDKSCRENRKSKHTFYVQQFFFFRKYCLLLDSVEKCGRVRQATHNIKRLMLDNQGHRHTLRMGITYFLHDNSVYANAPLCYVYTYLYLSC